MALSCTRPALQNDSCDADMLSLVLQPRHLSLDLAGVQVICRQQGTRGLSVPQSASHQRGLACRGAETYGHLCTAWSSLGDEISSADRCLVIRRPQDKDCHCLHYSGSQRSPGLAQELSAGYGQPPKDLACRQPQTQGHH